MDIFQDIDSNLLQLENASEFDNNNQKEVLQNQIKVILYSNIINNKRKK